MSIVKTRQFLEKRGCGTTVSVILGIVFIIGFIAITRGGGRQGAGQDRSGEVLFRVGELTVTQGLWDLANNQGQGGENSIESRPLGDRAQELGSELNGMLRTGYVLAAAKRAGIDVGNREVDAEIQREQDLVISNGAEARKMSVADFKKSRDAKLILEKMQHQFEGLKSVDGGQDFLRAVAATNLLMNKLSRGVNPTDDEVKHSNDSMMMREITVHANGAKEADAKAKLDKVLAEIKKDGFVKVADRYASAGPTADVTADKTPAPLPRDQIEMTPEFAPLKSLKLGDVSSPITSGPDTILFNLVEIKDNSPKDFDKNKDNYRKSYIEMLKAAALDKAIKDQQAITKVEWVDKSYEVLRKWMLASPFSFDEQAAIAKDASAMENSHIATYVAYSAIDRAWMVATPKQKEDNLKLRQSIFESVLEFTEDSKLRLELADSYIDQKNGPDALKHLQAIVENASDYSKETEETLKQVDVRVKKLVDEKLVKADAVQPITELKEKWLKDKARDAADAAEQAKAQAKEKADQAKADKEYDEAYKKTHHGQLPPGSTPTTPPTNPPSSTPPSTPGKGK